MEVINMKKIIVATDYEIRAALANSQSGDIICVKPGSYFENDQPTQLRLVNKVTLQGMTDDANDVVFKNAFIILGHASTIYLKNLTINLDCDKLNTIAIYDNSKVYGDNIIVNRTNPKQWNTVFCQDSDISLINSIITSDTDENTAALSLENSQLYAENTEIYFYASKNSQSIIKSTVIDYAVCLLNNSELYFNELVIDPQNNSNTSSCYLSDNSVFYGENIIFSENDCTIEVDTLDNSTFDINNLKSDQRNLEWIRDDDATVLIDGERPSEY